jgi:hypothetical protein
MGHWNVNTLEMDYNGLSTIRLLAQKSFGSGALSCSAFCLLALVCKCHSKAPLTASLEQLTARVNLTNQKNQHTSEVFLMVKCNSDIKINTISTLRLDLSRSASSLTSPLEV